MSLRRFVALIESLPPVASVEPEPFEATPPDEQPPGEATPPIQVSLD